MTDNVVVPCSPLRNLTVPVRSDSPERPGYSNSVTASLVKLLWPPSSITVLYVAALTSSEAIDTSQVDVDS